ncbi:hypothetical protein EDC94DRAFT_599135 [Helicostylum pulchrum]|nr:hypothetical protein EDC94DRAFT_599135 [Helicostylum pulchrum]
MTVAFHVTIQAQLPSIILPGFFYIAMTYTSIYVNVHISMVSGLMLAAFIFKVVVLVVIVSIQVCIHNVMNINDMIIYYFISMPT